MPFPGTQQLPYQFSGGLNSIIQEFSLDSPNLQNADNVVFNIEGQLDKRTGLTALSETVVGSASLSAGAAITVFNQELIVMDGQYIYTRDVENDVWINRGVLFSTINGQVRVINTKIATQQNPDCTTLNNLQLYIWEDDRPRPVNTGAGIRYSLIDTETGAFIVQDQFVYPLGFCPKVIGVSETNSFNLYYQASNNALFLNTVSTTQPQVISPLTQIISDGVGVSNKMPYDVCLVNGTPQVAYASQTGIKVYVSPTESIQYADASDVICVAMCIGSNNGQWIAFSGEFAGDGGLGGTFVQNLKTTIITQIDTLFAVNISLIEDLVEGNLNITYEIAGTGGNPNYIKNAILSSTNQVSQIGSVLKVGLASKPFRVLNNLFVNTVFYSALQATYFTLCLNQNFSCVAKHSPQNGGNYRDNGIMAQCDAVDSSGMNFIFAGQRKGAFTSYQTSQAANLGCAGYSIDFSNTNCFNNVADSNNLHIVGGVPRIYDGVSCVEDNFNYFPELPDGYGADVVLENGQGNLTYNPLTTPNSYQWAVCYEWTDNFGQVQRSNPGFSNAFTTTEANQGALLTVPTLTLTDKINPRTPVIISIFRTQDSLPIFYKITDDDNPLVNDPTQDTLTYLDTFSDAEIAPNENLYTGSQLANISPPACSLISLYQNRLMINSTEDKNVVWFSQNKFEQDQYNTIPLDWNTSFVEGVDSRLGTGITTIGLLGNSLAIFKENSIFILTGDGPNALDTSGQFNDAQLLVSNVGCNNANSLCFITQTPTLPGGLVFQSSQGIYLLGIDNNLYPIGLPVTQYNYLTITSANLLPTTDMIVFTSLEGICLVYNYAFNTWTTWSTLPAVDATVWQDQLVIMTPNGQVMVQDGTRTIYEDTFNVSTVYPIITKITTPWLKMGGVSNMQGKMAVYNALLLGTLQAPHTLLVQTAYDYNSSIIESAIINSNLATNRWGSLPIWGSPGTWGMDNVFSNYQFEINFSHPRGTSGGGCQAIQMTFIDQNPQSNAGYSFNALNFEVLPLPGPFNLPTSNKIQSQ